MRRRIIATFAGLILVAISLTACGSEAEQSADPATETAEQAMTPAAEPTTAAPAPAAPPAAPVETAEAELSPADFSQPTPSEWTAIAADPEFYQGELVMLFGRITDAAMLSNVENGYVLSLDVGPQPASLADGYPTKAKAMTGPIDIEDTTTHTNFVIYAEVTGTYNMSSEGGPENAPMLNILRMSEA